MPSDALTQHLTFANPGWLLRRLIYRDLKQVRSHATGRLLDIGCGQMPYRGLFAQVTEYVGIDHPNPYHPHDRPSMWASGLVLPFADAVFDTVLATQVLEHVPEPAMFLAEMSRVLRPNGVVLLTAPHIWDLHEQPYDYYRYTCFGLHYLLEQAGFAVELIQPQGGFFIMIAQRSSYFAFRMLHKLRLRPLAIGSAFGINCLGMLFDALYSYKGDTLNYLAVARKHENESYA